MHDAPHDQPNYMLYNYSRVRARASLDWVDFLWVSWGSWIIGFTIKQVNDATGNDEMQLMYLLHRAIPE